MLCDKCKIMMLPVKSLKAIWVECPKCGKKHKMNHLKD